MKLFFIGLLAIFVNSSANAFSLKCQVSYTENFIAGTNSSFDSQLEDINFLYTEKGLECVSRKGKKYSLKIKELGPELFSASSNGDVDGFSPWINVSCPLVSETRLEKLLHNNKTFKVTGIHASAGAVFTLKAGISVNHRGAICFISELFGFGFGGGVAIDSFTLEKRK